MQQKKRIVLIDDDQTTNTLNKLIIERSKLVDEVVMFGEAEKALEFLRNEKSGQKSLILLDINMPYMNGWEFLNEYVKLNGSRRFDKIIMLTSSIDPSDITKAQATATVTDYKSKPLSFEMLESLVSEYLN